MSLCKDYTLHQINLMHSFQAGHHSEWFHTLEGGQNTWAQERWIRPGHGGEKRSGCLRSPCRRPDAGAADQPISRCCAHNC